MLLLLLLETARVAMVACFLFFENEWCGVKYGARQKIPVDLYIGCYVPSLIMYRFEAKVHLQIQGRKQ
jgi:hypothetical protein